MHSIVFFKQITLCEAIAHPQAKKKKNEVISLPHTKHNI